MALPKEILPMHWTSGVQKSDLSEKTQQTRTRSLSSKTYLSFDSIVWHRCTPRFFSYWSKSIEIRVWPLNRCKLLPPIIPRPHQPITITRIRCTSSIHCWTICQQECSVRSWRIWHRSCQRSNSRIIDFIKYSRGDHQSALFGMHLLCQSVSNRPLTSRWACHQVR